MDIKLFFALLLTFLPVHDVLAHKFLVYSTRFGPSHNMFMGRIADELALAGHKVVSR